MQKLTTLVISAFMVLGSAHQVAGESLDSSRSLHDVEVNGVSRSHGVRSSQVSAVDIPVAAVRRMPAFFGEADVIKALQKIPGVSQGAEGKSGLYVRGGDYDQNLLLLDGATMFSSEHLAGYMSTINTDMLGGITFYKGAFPARFGGRLSSIVDMSVRNGSFEAYHGGITLGVLSSKVQAEGPIAKGHTSFNIAARASYFDLIALPVLRKVADNEKNATSYANMDFYDVTLRLAHRMVNDDLITLTAFYGHDTNNATPSNSAYDSNETSDFQKSIIHTRLEERLDNRWTNTLASLKWDHHWSHRFGMSTRLAYTGYNYRLVSVSNQDMQQSIYHSSDGNFDQPYSQMSYQEEAMSTFCSLVETATLAADFSFNTGNHAIKWGVMGSHNALTPEICTYRYRDILTSSNLEQKHEIFTKDNTLGGREKQVDFGIYAEDDWSINRLLKTNIGVRYSLYGVKGHIYSVVEPRLSMRVLVSDKLALKCGFSRMSQGIHQLVSSNLVNPSDVWVPTTASIKPMTADQIAVAVNYQPVDWLDLSLEGYYKRMATLLEYREGASFLSMKDSWEKLVAMGDGEAYGLELLVQKRVGNLTGWAGYCWSKAFRTFDRPGQEINGGKRFYACNDRRNNINILLSYRLNQHWEFNASWSYLTGRRGNIATVGTYGGLHDEINPVFNLSKLLNYGPLTDCNQGGFVKFVQFVTYTQRNSYLLPAEHHMDIGISYSFRLKRLDNTVNFSIYNLYNHKNISNVFLGYDEDSNPVLKGVCKLPFMPSISYSLKF